MWSDFLVSYRWAYSLTCERQAPWQGLVVGVGREVVPARVAAPGPSATTFAASWLVASVGRQVVPA